MFLIFLQIVVAAGTTNANRGLAYRPINYVLSNAYHPSLQLIGRANPIQHTVPYYISFDRSHASALPASLFPESSAAETEKQVRAEAPSAVPPSQEAPGVQQVRNTIVPADPQVVGLRTAFTRDEDEFELEDFDDDAPQFFLRGGGAFSHLRRLPTFDVELDDDDEYVHGDSRLRYEIDDDLDDAGRYVRGYTGFQGRSLTPFGSAEDLYEDRDDDDIGLLPFTPIFQQRSRSQLGLRNIPIKLRTEYDRDDDSTYEIFDD